MSQIRVFSGSLPTNQIVRSDSIKDAVGFYIVAPDSIAELEIETYLQIEISPLSNRLVRLADNVTDTITYVPIPNELFGIGLNSYVAVISSFPITLEIYAVFQEVFACEQEINQLQESIDQLASDFAFEATRSRIVDVAQITNEIAQNTSLGILSLSLAPITLGVSATAVQPLLGGSSVLAPLLLP